MAIGKYPKYTGATKIWTVVNDYQATEAFPWLLTIKTAAPENLIRTLSIGTLFTNQKAIDRARNYLGWTLSQFMQEVSRFWDMFDLHDRVNERIKEEPFVAAEQLIARGLEIPDVILEGFVDNRFEPERKNHQEVIAVVERRYGDRLRRLQSIRA